MNSVGIAFKKVLYLNILYNIPLNSMINTVTSYDNMLWQSKARKGVKTYIRVNP